MTSPLSWSDLADAFVVGDDQPRLDRLVEGAAPLDLQSCLVEFDRIRQPGPIAGRDWELLRRVLEGIAATSGSLDALVDWVDTHAGVLDPWQVYKVANRVAWVTRGARTQLPSVIDTEGRRFALYVAVERRRFAFDDAGMAEILDQVRVVESLEDVPVRAFRSFVALRRVTDADEADRLVRAALESPQTGIYREIAFDVAAHALWLNSALEPRGVLLQQVCESWIRALGEGQTVAVFRLAAALRWQNEFTLAIRRAEQALAQIAGTNEFARTFAEQCVRERELCVAGREIEALREYVDDQERRSVTRTIEVITLFTAAAAFALGGVSSATSLSATPGQFLVVMSGFAWALGIFAVVVIGSLELFSGRRDVRTVVRRAGAVAAVVAALGLALLIVSAVFANNPDWWS